MNYQKISVLCSVFGQNFHILISIWSEYRNTIPLHRSISFSIGKKCSNFSKETSEVSLSSFSRLSWYSDHLFCKMHNCHADSFNCCNRIILHEILKVMSVIKSIQNLIIGYLRVQQLSACTTVPNWFPEYLEFISFQFICCLHHRKLQ
jgi:hypothetical protein